MESGVDGPGDLLLQKFNSLGSGKILRTRFHQNFVDDVANDGIGRSVTLFPMAVVLAFGFLTHVRGEVLVLCDMNTDVCLDISSSIAKPDQKL